MDNIVPQIEQVLGDKEHMLFMHAATLDTIAFRKVVCSFGCGYVYVDMSHTKFAIYHLANEIYANVPELINLIPNADDKFLRVCHTDANILVEETLLHSVLRALDGLKPFVIHIRLKEDIADYSVLLSFFQSLEINRRYLNLKIVIINGESFCNVTNNSLQMFKRINIEEENLSFVRTSTNLNKNVFVSYSWKEPSNHIVVNDLKPAFIKNNIDFILDKNDCNYRSNIPEFEERIGRGEFIVAVISNEYVHSIQCMYEMACVFENGEVTKRLLPLCFDQVKRNDKKYYEEIVEYWRHKISETKINIEQMGEPENGVYKKDLQYLEKIQYYLSDFFCYLCSTNTLTLTEIGKNDFEKLIDIVLGGSEKLRLETSTITPEIVDLK